MNRKALALASFFLLTAGCNCSKNRQKNKKTATPVNNTKGSINMSNITRTASGLGLEILTPGTGARPIPGQTVSIHYTGWLDNNGQPGREFDSSVKRGSPFTTKIGVGQLIAGWDEGVPMMQVGEKSRLHIPARLGYGARGAGAAIPPNADLIFDVELLAIK